MISISFLGDISLNGEYISLNEKGMNPFSDLESSLGSSDYVIGNLECMVKSEVGENLLKRPRISTTEETLTFLKNIHLSIACLAQNHIYDHLEDGYLRTTTFLDREGILRIGAGLTLDEVQKPIIVSKNGISLAILNFLTIDTNPNLPENSRILLNIFDLNHCKNQINALKEKNINHIILSLHWGGRVEGGLYPDWYQPSMARELINAGADLIIGHHSHTIQPFEIYKGKYIFYSIGNFCFSDYWFDEKYYPMSKRRMITQILKISFSIDTYSVQSNFFRNKIEEFSPYDQYEPKLRRRNRIFKFLRNNRMAWQFYFWNKNNILPILLFFQRNDISFGSKWNRFLKYIFKRIN